MSAAALKNDLIKVIINTEDIKFLQQVKDIFKKQNATLDWWDEITDHEKEMIELGLNDIEEGRVLPHEEGRVLPHEEVRAEINELLRKN